MRLDWTAESDEEGTIYLRIYPKDQREREDIVTALSDLIGEGDSAYATLYGETIREIYGITEDPEGRVLSYEGNERPDLEIRVWRDR